MVVRKILEATLVAGSTSVTFTDTDIPNSLLRVYCSRSALFPISQTLSGNSVTVTYKPQDSNIGVALEIVKSGLDIVDDLVTDDSTKALSANQGYVLKGLIDDIVIPTVPENITDLDDVSVTSIQNGQVLAWNSLTEKFENVNQSGGDGGENYSTTEQVIGTWINGETLYKKTINFGALPNTNTKNVNHNISNLSKIIEISGATNDGSNTLPIPYINSNQLSSSVQIIVTSTQISIRTAANLSSYTDTYVTIKYIKTS